MADIPLDALVSGGGDGVMLSGSQVFTLGAASSGANGVGFALTPTANIGSALTTVLSLTGRRVLSYLFLQSIDTTSGSLRLQLLVDGVVVLDQTEASSTRNSVLILGSSLMPVSIKSNSSIELRAQKPSSTAVQATYGSLVIL